MSRELPVVVIDPGHGGSAAVGGSSPNNARGPNGLLEKDLTLDVARRLASSLAGSARVLLTRTEDVNLSLAARAQLARDNRARLFLSIHFNGFHDSGTDGTEVWVARDAGATAEGFAQRVLSRLVAVTRVSNRGVRRSNFGVLLKSRHQADTLACLAEIAFLTNPEQARRLEAEEYRRQLAAALEEAVRHYLPEQHFLHHDAVRPGERIPPPVPFGLSARGFGAGVAVAEAPPVERRGDEPGARAALYAAPLDSRIRFALGASVGTGGTNHGDDILALKTRLIELGYDWLTRDRNLDRATVAVINLVQSILAGRHTVSGDGRVSVPGATYRWLQAVNAPRWQLMPEGSRAEGFYNVERADTRDNHDYGTSWMAEAIVAVAAAYRDAYLSTHPNAALFTVNDVSVPHGGNTPDHATHETGMACDLRLPLTDGTAPGGGVTYRHPRYDQSAARGMLTAIRTCPLVTRIFFNDPVLVREGLCRKTSPTDSVHDDHIHFEVGPPPQGAVEMVEVRSTPGAAPASFEPALEESSSDAEHSYGSALQNAPACAAGTALSHRSEHDWSALHAQHGTVAPNVILRWNDLAAAGGDIDVVVHFHGWAPESLTGRAITNMSLATHKEPHSGLIGPDGVTPACRGRATLAIIPRGVHGPQPGKEHRYIFPFFTRTRNALEQLINYSLGQLAAQFHPSQAFRARRLILTAHSGGGEVVLGILAHRAPRTRPADPRVNDPHEIHLFDATYGSQGGIVNWAQQQIAMHATGNADERGALRVLYIACSPRGRPAGTEPGALDIQRRLSGLLRGTSVPANCYQVERVPDNVYHNYVPRTYGPQLLANPDAAITPAAIPSSPCPHPPSPPPAQQRTGAQALDSQRRHGPLPYHEAVETTNAFCRDNVGRWQERVQEAETRLANGLMTRFEPDAVAQLANEQSCFSMLGRAAEFEPLQRRLRAVLDRTVAWVFDINQSAIAQIEDAAQRARFLNANWDNFEYPGNRGDTSLSEALFNEMARLVPERRVPRLITFQNVDGLVVEVPDSRCDGCDPLRHSGTCRLLPPARDSFVRMRAAAAAYGPAPAQQTAQTGQQPAQPRQQAAGVALRIGDAFRNQATQQLIAASNPNPVAVAQNRSAHTYGLAIDLCLLVPGLDFVEIHTRPMKKLVRMYKSPAYKWMYLFGSHYGWFPYRAEPWHWEYNPEGFPERFRTLVSELRAAARGH